MVKIDVKVEVDPKYLKTWANAFAIGYTQGRASTEHLVYDPNDPNSDENEFKRGQEAAKGFIAEDFADRASLMARQKARNLLVR